MATMVGDPSLSDDALVQAMRRRLLDEIQAHPHDVERIVNNVYGGGLSGTMGQAFQGEPEDLDRDYMVDILRENLPEGSPDAPAGGWRKKVHRYVQDKKKA